MKTSKEVKNKIIRVTTVPKSLNLIKGQLGFLNQYFEIVAVSGNSQKLYEIAEREGIRVESVNMERRISPVKDFISLVKLYKVFRREKPEMVHSITPKAGLLSMLAGKMAGVPIRIHTFTGLVFPSKEGMMQKLLIQMDRLLCWAATNVYPEGQGVKKDLIKFKITSKPLKIIANGNVNGINTSFFSPSLFSAEEKHELRKSLNISDNDFVFVFVGRLVRDKGINELISVFKNIDFSEYGSVKLLLVGGTEGKIDPIMPETLQEINNNPNIVSVGFQKDVRPFFSISDCLVFPSYREGFPNVVIEAGSMGLPSIVSDINGCNEIIVNTENGIIVPPKDVEALRKAVISILKDKELREKLKENSRRMIETRYQQEYVWNELLKEYEYLLSARTK